MDQWLNNELRRGLVQLLCLRLDSSPPDDMIEGTAQAWLVAVCKGRVWDQHRDAPRIRDAFETLLATCSRWPLPADLIRALPEPTAQPRIEHVPDIPDTRTGRMARLDTLIPADFKRAAAGDEA